MAHVVAIEQIGVITHRQQLPVHGVGDGRFARPREPGEPGAARALPLDVGACGAIDIELLPMQVAGAVQGEVDGACGDGGMAVAIDQDETAQGAIARVGFERDRSEEHTSELQSLMRNSYAVFCLNKKINPKHYNSTVNLNSNDT